MFEWNAGLTDETNFATFRDRVFGQVLAITTGPNNDAAVTREQGTNFMTNSNYNRRPKKGAAVEMTKWALPVSASQCESALYVRTKRNDQKYDQLPQLAATNIWVHFMSVVKALTSEVTKANAKAQDAERRLAAQENRPARELAPMEVQIPVFLKVSLLSFFSLFISILMARDAFSFFVCAGIRAQGITKCYASRYY